MQRFITAGKPFGVVVCKQRRADGRDGLASSLNLLLPDAEATGNLTSISNAVVRTITTDKNTGQPNGCIFIDRLSHREMEIRAGVIVLAAGTLESTRLLLNSGLANSSGLVGRYLCDQIYGAGLVCSVPEARGTQRKGLMGGSAIVPRFRNISDKSQKFLRGYALNVTSSTGSLGASNFTEYGEALERKMEEYSGSGIHMTIMGEVLPRYENHVRINTQKTDAWGIPVLHIETKYTDNEFNMAADAVDTMCEVAHSAGFDVLSQNKIPNPPGYSIHEVGTCRMGDDPKKSVLNRWSQSHDHKNLWVVDGAGFTSSGWQNPTMTILALSMRASEHLADEMRKGNV
jgi:choline dehydrogenase-like flavoprotein